jgi:hypothetical protein
MPFETPCGGSVLCKSIWVFGMIEWNACIPGIIFGAVIGHEEHLPCSNHYIRSSQPSYLLI